MKVTKWLSGFAVGIAAVLLLSFNQLNTLQGSVAPSATVIDKTYNFDFETVKPKGPRLNTRSAILVNYDSGEVLYAKNAEMVQSIASISKLVTAMVFLDHVNDLDQTMMISRDDAFKSSFSRLRPGMEMTLMDILHASLMISDNRATRALARAVSGSYDAFAIEMNKKCKDLGLKNTVFYDPTGLDDRNVSTAHEVALILHHAYKYPLIAQITSTKQYTLFIKRGRKTYPFQFRNTNRLMDAPYHVLAGKTGYIEASAYCLTTLVQNEKGEKLTLVVLGSPGGSLRFKEARKLVTWGFNQLHVPMAGNQVNRNS